MTALVKPSAPQSLPATRPDATRDDGLLVLTGPVIASLLAGRERELVQAVRRAYEAHARGETSNPHSLFLRFPDDPANRIIALPAYVGAGFGLAGIKWIASFPRNIDSGLDRASAVIVLNSIETGRPAALLEGSILSAKRTAASAALAAQCMHQDGRVSEVGLIGCGLINFEVVRFLLAMIPGIEALLVCDVNPTRARHFSDKCRALRDDLVVRPVSDPVQIFQRSSLISIATTAIEPHLRDTALCGRRRTVLHISLRDFAPEVILAADNVVDDVDHVCRAQTSIHLAEQMSGGRDFIRCTLGDILAGRQPARRDEESVAVFSPFGLGILDIAAAKLAYDLGIAGKQGTVIDAFLPEPWSESIAINHDEPRAGGL